MASAADGLKGRAAFVVAVLAVLILPSLGYQAAPVPEPAPAPVRLCSDCNSHCSSMCDGDFQLAQCRSLCNSGPPPECQKCRSDVLTKCTAGCKNGCDTSCGSKCDCAGICTNACDRAVEDGCHNACTYPYDPNRWCGGCMAGAAQDCARACYSECNANCVTG